ncbi:hypothetical protein AB0F91_46295 [Amycolatopsis sp. NPDC023774]|uniref:hypothetical protein n=1 Tax=Amycolatopsis sp. NPDC023774 TaxID=3155015 RepID=UPI0033C0FE5B
MLRYSDTEWAVIVQAAALAGRKPAPWAQQAAYDAARAEHPGTATYREAVAALTQELREHRRVLTNVGGNLNDVAKVANATGEIEIAQAAVAIMRLIANVVRTSDTVIKDVRERLVP